MRFETVKSQPSPLGNGHVSRYSGFFWRHIGQLIATTHCELIALRASKLQEVLVQNDPVKKYAKLFARYFKKNPDVLNDTWADVELLQEMAARAFMDDEDLEEAPPSGHMDMVPEECCMQDTKATLARLQQSFPSTPGRRMSQVNIVNALMSRTSFLGGLPGGGNNKRPSSVDKKISQLDSCDSSSASSSCDSSSCSQSSSSGDESKVADDDKSRQPGKTMVQNVCSVGRKQLRQSVHCTDRGSSQGISGGRNEENGDSSSESSLEIFKLDAAGQSTDIGEVRRCSGESFHNGAEQVSSCTSGGQRNSGRSSVFASRFVQRVKPEGEEPVKRESRFSGGRRGMGRGKFGKSGGTGLGK